MWCPSWAAMNYLIDQWARGSVTFKEVVASVHSLFSDVTDQVPFLSKKSGKMVMH